MKMEIYKNSYNKNEDGMLWELHEIMHELHKEIFKKTIDNINKEAFDIFKQWQLKYKETCTPRCGK